MFNEVQELIERVRPYIQRDGGDIELIKVEDGIVYVSLSGACDGCSMVDVTLFDGLERLLVEQVPGVIAVVQV